MSPNVAEPEYTALLITVFPVPFGVITMSEFDVVLRISLSVISICPSIVIFLHSNGANSVSTTAFVSASDVVSTALNVSSPSFQYSAALFAAPLLINSPASRSEPPEFPLLNSNNESDIFKVVFRNEHF